MSEQAIEQPQDQGSLEVPVAVPATEPEQPSEDPAQAGDNPGAESPIDFSIEDPVDSQLVGDKADDRQPEN